MDQTNITDRDLVLLEQIELNPDINQASLATQLGVAVGTVNWHLKRLISKGYVKVRRLERKKLRYIITPEGISLRARLTMDYVQSSFRMYRLVRERMIEVLHQVRQAGFHQVILNGDGEVADVCRLSCLEQEIEVLSSGNIPELILEGYKILIQYPQSDVKINSIEQDVQI
ncbi:MAG: winged helix-turn-helix transcriptional regulator [Anaerolineaceae bacterium]